MFGPLNPKSPLAQVLQFRFPSSKGTAAQNLQSNGDGTTAWVTATATANPSTNNFRLTLVSGTPVADATAAGTIYLTPFTGVHLSTYDSSVWTDHTSAEISIVVPSFAYRMYNLYVYWTGSALALETDAWDSGGQTTISITGATAAAPIVLTATNSLSAGDFIAVDGITGTIGTAASTGINTKVWKIQSRTSTTITLEGSDGTSNAYTSGGTVYKIASSATTAPVRQDGVWCKTGALSRKLVGTFFTKASATTSDDPKSRLLANEANVIQKKIGATETASSWTYSANAYRPANNSTDVGKARIEIVRVRAERYTNLRNYQAMVGSASNTNLDAGIGLNSCISATTLDAGLGFVTVGNGQYVPQINEVASTLTQGYNFIQRVENGGFSGNAMTLYGAEASGVGVNVMGSGLAGTTQQ